MAEPPSSPIDEDPDPDPVLGLPIRRVLPIELMVILAQFDTPFEQVYERFQHARRKAETGKKEGWPPTYDFLCAVKVKRLMNELVRMPLGGLVHSMEGESGRKMQAQGGWDVILDPVLEGYAALMLNCEIVIWRLCGEVGDTRRHPFLTHWVEAEKEGQWVWDVEAGLGKEREADFVRRKIHTARLGLVRGLLTWDQDKMADDIGRMSARELCKRDWMSSKHFPLESFLLTLVEDGVYTMEEACGLSTSNGATKSTNRIPSTSDGLPHHSPTQASSNATHPQLSTDTVLDLLLQDPTTTRQALAHLPVDIPPLDTLNTALASDILPALDMPRADLIRDYLQHALRTLERFHNSTTNIPSPSISPSLPPDNTMSAPRVSATARPVAGPSTTIPRNYSTYSPLVDANEEVTTPPPLMDKEAEKRAVQLLILFIKSCVKKGFASPDDVAFEIQEICVRWIWMREVREFRGFFGFGRALG